MIARTVRIEGKVQGVFFRDWAVETARGFGLAGWVRNRRDGSVEILAEGEAALIDRFVDRLREGSPPSRIDRLSVGDTKVCGIDGFARAANRLNHP